MGEVVRSRVAGISRNYGDSQAEYNDWATSYDTDLEKVGYRSFVVTADYVCKSVPENERQNVRILDVGAGTGLVAKVLRQRGFVNMDALDPNENMMNEARQQDLYDNYFIEGITGEPSSLEENSYDIITGSGIFVPNGHMPSEAIKEMIRLVKPGGYVVLVNRPTVIRQDIYKDLEPLIDLLEKQGKWKKLTKEIFPRYFMNEDGLVYHYQVL